MAVYLTPTATVIAVFCAGVAMRRCALCWSLPFANIHFITARFVRVRRRRFAHRCCFYHIWRLHSRIRRQQHLIARCRRLYYAFGSDCSSCDTLCAYKMARSGFGIVCAWIAFAKYTQFCTFQFSTIILSMAACAVQYVYGGSALAGKEDLGSTATALYITTATLQMVIALIHMLYFISLFRSYKYFAVRLFLALMTTGDLLGSVKIRGRSKSASRENRSLVI